jgi:hypothetical protein
VLDLRRDDRRGRRVLVVAIRPSVHGRKKISIRIGAAVFGNPNKTKQIFSEDRTWRVETDRAGEIAYTTDITASAPF